MSTYTVTVIREDNQWVAMANGLGKGVVRRWTSSTSRTCASEGLREIIADLTDAEDVDIECWYKGVIQDRRAASAR
ncbi:MAG: hypothetical protein ACRDQ5_02465 [Sciscionella sp.]